MELEVEDVVDPILFLLSDASSMLNGSAFQSDVQLGAAALKEEIKTSRCVHETQTLSARSRRELIMDQFSM